MDSAKFLVVPFAVLLVAIFLLGRWQRPGSRAGRFAWVASLVAITLPCEACRYRQRLRRCGRLGRRGRHEVVESL